MIKSFAIAFSLCPIIAEAALPATSSTKPNDFVATHLEKWPPEVVVLNPSAKSVRVQHNDSLLSEITRIRGVRFGGWDDEGGMYIASEQAGYPQLYHVPIIGAKPEPSTAFDKRKSGFYLNPNPSKKNFLVTKDEGGNEDFQLELFDLRTKKSRALGCPPGRVDGLIWNDSGTAFAYGHTPKGTDRWDLRLNNVDGKDTLILSRPGTWMPMNFSPDGHALLIQHYISASIADVFILSLKDGTLTSLLPSDSVGFVDNAVFVNVSGGLAVAYTSDRDGEFHRLYLVQGRPSILNEMGQISPKKNWKYSPLSREEASRREWDIEWVEANPERNGLVYSRNQEGYSVLHHLDLKSLSKMAKPKALTGIPPGLIDGVHFRPSKSTAVFQKQTNLKSNEFAYTLIHTNCPGEVYTYNLKTQASTRWTYSDTARLLSTTIHSPQLIRFPTLASSSDSISAWLTMPMTKVHSGFNRPIPLLILIHGGPESQARPGFDANIRYLTGVLGFAVIQPNVRGSSGYGKSFQKADDGFLRMESVHDIGALLAWVKTNKQLDTNRIGVAGRSYGGFMALSTLIEYGRPLAKDNYSGNNHSGLNPPGLNLVRAGISTVGITHFPTFLQKTSGYRRHLRRVEYGDEREPKMAAFLDSISPLTRIDRLHNPLLLTHGRNDPRVPYSESERIFAALKAQHIPTWFLTFEEEGHGVHDQESQVVQYRIMSEFMTEALDFPQD